MNLLKNEKVQVWVESSMNYLNNINCNYMISFGYYNNFCGRTFILAPNQVLFVLGWVRIDLRPTRTNLLNLTSRRDASHPYLISLWPKEGLRVLLII